MRILLDASTPNHVAFSAAPHLAGVPTTWTPRHPIKVDGAVKELAQPECSHLEEELRNRSKSEPCASAWGQVRLSEPGAWPGANGGTRDGQSLWKPVRRRDIRNKAGIVSSGWRKSC